MLLDLEEKNDDFGVLPGDASNSIDSNNGFERTEKVYGLWDDDIPGKNHNYLRANVPVDVPNICNDWIGFEDKKVLEQIF